mgnify:CR=1 FL=1
MNSMAAIIDELILIRARLYARAKKYYKMTGDADGAELVDAAQCKIAVAIEYLKKSGVEIGQEDGT